MARSYDEAVERATQAVADAIGGAPAACRDSLHVTVSDNFEAGQPITVTATCTYALSDIGLPGAPGSVHPESSFTSMLDPYRGVQ